jgi:hypothetical protein
MYSKISRRRLRKRKSEGRKRKKRRRCSKRGRDSKKFKTRFWPISSVKEKKKRQEVEWNNCTSTSIDLLSLTTSSTRIRTSSMIST